MSGIIIYYVVGPVHPRNLKMIADELPDWTFRATYERSAKWLKDETLAIIPGDRIPLIRNRVPEALWSGNVRAVVFSTTQPRQGPINLLRSALERGVPTIAIEESNQIMFNNGTVNNYVMPVDHVLVASSYERQGMIEDGIPEDRIEVTGWPFYAGRIGKTEPDRKREMKVRYGLAPDRPVATLALTALNDAGESPAIRRLQLRLASKGLPSEYQLAVKPHPIESLDVLMPFVKHDAPNAHVIDGMERIDDVLEATDVLLSRGRSQTSFEALIREIPVIVLDCGGLTPFHAGDQDLIVAEPGRIAHALDRLSAVKDSMELYSPVREAHLPFPPEKARELTSRRIAEIASDSDPAVDRARQWFDLAMYQAWVGSRRQALVDLSHCGSLSPDRPVNALRNLIRLQATRQDIEQLKQYAGARFLSHVLRCLWIDQLHRWRQHPKNVDLAWMKSFPPAANTVWFVRHLDMWVDLLLRSGRWGEASGLASELELSYMHVRGISPIVEGIGHYNTGLFGRLRYIHSRTKRRIHYVLVRRWLRLLS